MQMKIQCEIEIPYLKDFIKSCKEQIEDEEFERIMKIYEKEI